MKNVHFNVLSKIFLITMCVLEQVQCNNNRREKRFALVFSPSTVMQFSFGATFPAQLPKRTISLDFAYQQNLILPTTFATSYPPLISKRTVSDETNLDDDIDRIAMYKFIIETLNNIGLDGEICLLRSICEISEFPMHTEDPDNLLEKIVHYIFTPSDDLDYFDETYLENNVNSNHYGQFYDKILEAEFLGKTRGKCHKEFFECNTSVVSLFTKLYYMNLH